MARVSLGSRRAAISREPFMRTMRHMGSWCTGMARGMWGVWGIWSGMGLASIIIWMARWRGAIGLRILGLRRIPMRGELSDYFFLYLLFFCHCATCWQVLAIKSCVYSHCNKFIDYKKVQINKYKKLITLLSINWLNKSHEIKVYWDHVEEKNFIFIF